MRRIIFFYFLLLISFHINAKVNLADLEACIVRTNIDNYHQYENDFDYAIDKEPKNVDIYFLRAIFYLNAQQPEKTLINLNQAIKLDSTNLDFDFFESLAYSETGKFQEALSVMQKFKKADSMHPAIFFAQGFSLEYRDSVKAAFNEYSIAKRMYARSPYVNNEDLYVNVYKSSGNLNLILGNYEEAINDFTLALGYTNVYVNRANIFFQRSICYKMINDSLRSSEDREYAFLSFPDLRLKGIIYACEGEKEKAHTIISELSKKKYSTRNEIIKLLDIACIYSILEETDQSIIFLQKAEKLGRISTANLDLNPLLENVRHRPDFKLIIQNNPKGNL